MRKLHHWALDPFSRCIRFALHEKKLAFETSSAPPWASDTEARKLNPIGGAPVLEEDAPEGRFILAEPRAILEYLDEAYPDHKLLPTDRIERTEARWVMGWLERGFDQDVNQTLLHERVMQRCLRAGTPNSAAMRKGAAALRGYLRHIDAMTGVRPYLAGENFSYADICAAAHLSCLDYFGDVPWSQFVMAQDWYIRMKSRIAFRPMLLDRLQGVAPARHYAELDA